MSDQDPNTPEQPADQPNVQGTVEDLLKAVIDDSGRQKFSSADELKKGYDNSQDFIKKLQQENQELRNKQEQAKGVQELVDEILSNRNQAPENNQTSEPESGINVAEEVNRILAEREAANAVAANSQKISSFLAEQYSNDQEATAALEKRASEMGFTKEELLKLGTNKPAAFFELMGVKKTTGAAPATGGVNTSAYSAPTTETPQPKKLSRHWTNREMKEVGDSWRNLSLEQIQEIKDASTKRLLGMP